MELGKGQRWFQKVLQNLYGVHGIIFMGYLFLILAVHVFLVQEDGLTVGVIVPLIFLLVFLVLACPVALRKAEAWNIPLQERSISRKEKVLWFFIFFIVCLLVLLHWYFAYYPGAFSSDTVYQYKQAVSGRYNDWKPILQTLITYTLPLKLTGRAEAIVLFQIIEYSCILAYMGCVIFTYSGKWYVLFSLLYILLNPVTGNIVVYPWKDVTFAMFVVLLMTFGLQVHMTDGHWLDSRRAVLLLGIVLAVATIVRHNGFLFTIPFLVAILIRIGKKRRIQIVLLFTVCVIAVKGPVRMALEVPETWNHTARVMGLPMSVLGNIAKECPESLDEETKEFLYSLAPSQKWQDVYTCGNFNSIKWQCDQPVIEDVGAAKILWMTVKSSFRAPVPALKGLIGLTDIVYTISGELDWDIRPAMAENDVGLEFQELHDRDAIESYTDFTRTGMLRYLFWYIGMINLVVIFSLLCKCRFRVKNDWKKILFALPLLIYNFGSMLLLSGDDFRYFYYAFPIVPMVILILFSGDVKNKEWEGYKKAYIKLNIRKIYDQARNILLKFGSAQKKKIEDSIKHIYAKLNIRRIYNRMAYILLEKIRYARLSIRKIYGRIMEILPESGPVYVLFVFVLAGTIIIGGKINTAETPYFHKLFLLDYGWIVLLCGVAFILGKLLIACMNQYQREAQRAEDQKRWWLGAFLGLLLMWVPYLLAYYPGVVTEDSLVSLMQAENLSLLYNHIPVAYTLLIALFTRIGWALGDRNFGVFLFTLVQMIVMAGVLSYSIYWIRTRISKNKAVTYILLLFYGLNPVIALYSVTMWKDVLFSAWILLFCLFLFDVGISKGAVLEGKKGLIRLGVLFTLAAFGRNNGIYVVILIWTVLLIIYKEIRIKLFAAGGGIILSILLIQGPGYQAMEIDQSGFAESVGIPLQQICYTVVQDGTLTEKDEEFLEKVIPIQTIKECYSPVSADNIKFNPEFDTAFFEAHKAEFIKLYLRMLPPNLPYYVESYLLSTVGFWHIEPIGWLGSDGVSKNEMGIYGIDYLKEWFHLDGKGKLTAAVTSMQRWPVTNVGLLVWLVFFYVMLSFMQKQPWKALTALPLVGCWLTIMIATPVCAQFRYVYYYHLMLPVICILLFIKRKEETREACELPGIPEECDSKEVPGE